MRNSRSIGGGATTIDQEAPTVEYSQPRDRYNLVYLILLIHGVGTLMPWNMFINANDYFTKYKLSEGANITVVESTQILAIDQVQLDNIRKNFLTYICLAAQLPNVFFNGFNLLFNVSSGNLRLRVNLTLIIEALIFIGTIILVVVDSSQWPILFFYITIVMVVVLNMASGIYQNCIFGTGAIFPGSYTNAILIGSNLSGTFTSVVNLLATWLAPKPQEAAMYYFITALVVILICIVTYNLLSRNPYFRNFNNASTNPKGNEINLDSQLELVDQNTAKVSSDVPDNLRDAVDAMVPRPSEADNSFKSNLREKWLVLSKCWPQCLNVFLTFYVTLALFPAVIANTRQKQGYFSEKYFTSFAGFFIFNVFALIGNLISGWTTWPGKNHVWIIVIARFLFVPFFLFCNFNAITRQWPVLIESDIIFILGNIMLALTSGYLSSLCMMFASSDLKPNEAPKAGMLAAFFLVLGILLGVYSSLFLTWIVELKV